MAVNKKQLDAILADLYAVDPDLKRFELELSRMVEEILVSRPNTKFDNAFKARLRAELLAHAAELQGKKSSSDSNVIINFFTMKKFAYVGGGALLAALILIPAFTFLYQSGNTPSLPGINRLIALSGTQEITSIAPNAFGSLAQNQAVALGLGAEGTRSSVGFGGGGAGVPAAMPSATTAVADTAVTSGKMISGTSIIAPDFVRYRYVYSGDPLSLPAGPQDVFKRLTGLGAAPSASTLLGRISLGLVNLGSFNQAKVQNVSIAEDTDFGYIITASFEEGMVSIYENWQKWPQVVCNDQNCYDRQRISIDEIPSDDELINIANQFIKARGINVSNYGTPEVDKTWRVAYDTATNKTEMWIPEANNVIYPLLINGQPVYEQGGMSKVGINVNINIRQKRVASIYNLTTQKYESSKYAVVSDVKKILAIVEQGGLYNGYPEGGKEVEVQVGTPTTILMRMYQYDQKTSRSNELLVPALMFPIIKAPENEPYFSQKYITVPIIEEMLTDQGGPIQIMPLGVPTPAGTSGAEPAPLR